MDKQCNRQVVLQRLNDYRASGILEIPQKEFEIISKLFLIIAEKINSEEDLECMKFIIIVSQTFYFINKENKKIYLHDVLVKNSMLQNYDIWLKYLLKYIEDEFQNAENPSNKNNIILTDKQKTEKVNNIIFAVLMSFCENVVDFCQDIEKIKKMLAQVFEKYHTDKEIQNNIIKFLEEKYKK